MRACVVALACLAVGASVVPAASAAEGRAVESLRLENGLTVLLRPIEGAKDAALVVLFDVGGDHDPPGRSGLAHLVEHVYVTAAAGRAPARTAAELMRAYPAGWNAQTGDRYTVVATVFPEGRLAAELAEAAARMGDLRIDDADLAREVPRVIDEVGNMFGGHPPLAAMNVGRELVRPTPHGGRRGGLPEQVTAIRVDDLRDRWRRYYKPANATLVLAGRFDPAAAKAAITSSFGPLPPGEKAPAPADPGAPLRGTTKSAAARPAPAAEPTVALAYAAPPVGDDRYAAYLIQICRLLAASAAAAGDRVQVVPPLVDDPACVYVIAPAKPGETAERAVARLDKFVAEAVTAAPPADGYALVADTLGPLIGVGDAPDAALAVNPYGVAFGLGRRRQLGVDEARLARDLQAADADDLRRVAAEVFGPDSRAAAFVAPAAK